MSYKQPPSLCSPSALEAKENHPWLFSFITLTFFLFLYIYSKVSQAISMRISYIINLSGRMVSHCRGHYLWWLPPPAGTSEGVASCQRWRRNCARPAHSAVLRAWACRSLMASQECTRCGGSRAVGGGEGGRALMAAAAGEEECTLESKDEVWPH